MILGIEYAQMRKHRRARNIRKAAFVEVSPVEADALEVRQDCADGFADASAVDAVWCTSAEQVAGSRSSMSARKPPRGSKFRGTHRGAQKGGAVVAELRSEVLDSAVGNVAVGMALGITSATGESGFVVGAGCGR